MVVAAAQGGWEARIIADSISESDFRLTTMEVRFPRIVLAEFNTHRMFSRNSASSRARPIEKVIEEVIQDPFVPSYWGANQKGMQAENELLPQDVSKSTVLWLAARNDAVESAKRLLEVGVHKQLVNRLLEPFMWHTAIVSATEWDNFFALRNNKDAQPEIQVVGELMERVYNLSQPELLNSGTWHLPYVTVEEKTRLDLNTCVKLSVARCARVSYLTHDGKRDIDADLVLHDRLLESRHMSPFEHVASPMGRWVRLVNYNDSWSGNFRGWVQLRKEIPHEDNAMKVLRKSVTDG